MKGFVKLGQTWSKDLLHAASFTSLTCMQLCKVLLHKGEGAELVHKL
jgi:hypothetical protein